MEQDSLAVEQQHLVVEQGCAEAASTTDHLQTSRGAGERFGGRGTGSRILGLVI